MADRVDLMRRDKKVKCDGAHPRCSRCINSSRACGGYSFWNISLTATPRIDHMQTSEHDAAPDPPAVENWTDFATENTSASMLPTVVQKIRPHISDKARGDVSFFIHIGMPGLIGNSPFRRLSEMSFTYIFSLMLDEPMLFHGIFALATLQRAKLRLVHSNLPLAIDDDHLRDSLEQYGRALSTSCEYIVALVPHPEHLSRLVLAGYVMFLFELCRGNWASATRHRRSSSAIARMHEGLLDSGPRGSQSKSALSVVKADDTYDPLLESRLNSFHDLGRGLEVLISDTRQLEADLFASIRMLSENAANKHLVNAVGARRCLKHCLIRSAPLDPVVVQRLDRLLQAHATWKAQFDSWKKTQQQDDPHVVLCEINHFASEFTIRTYHAMDKTASQQYETLCKAILNIISTYLRQWRTSQSIGCDPAPTSSAPNRAVSAFEYGILRTLYLISVRCTSIEVRKRAIQLLQSSRRKELEYDSATLATAARMTLAVQEHRADEIEPRGIGGLCFESFVKKTVDHDIVVSLDPAEDGTASVWYGQIGGVQKGTIELAGYEVQLQPSHHERSANFRPARVTLVDIIKIDSPAGSG